jgi:hypothetical protein
MGVPPLRTISELFSHPSLSLGMFPTYSRDNAQFLIINCISESTFLHAVIVQTFLDPPHMYPGGRPLLRVLSRLLNSLKVVSL